MTNKFFEEPILNSPYEYPSKHWELDDSGHPTQKVLPQRRKASFITPIPKPKKRKDDSKQEKIDFDTIHGLDGDSEKYETTSWVNRVRTELEAWRAKPDSGTWGVTPETARLLHHWRHHDFSGLRPFFCQIEAVETVIWLTEVAPRAGKIGAGYLEQLEAANLRSNPGLMRLALKLATGAGKTTVMAMIIAWQTINAVRRPNSTRFTRGFLVVAPGLTIKDRLRVLQPNDPDSYYQSRELVPQDMLPELERAKIVITNYHAFKRRERLDVSKGTRGALEGWRGESLETV
jgi:type III restriction enzyme